MYASVHEGSSTVPTALLSSAAAFRKRSVKQGAGVKSVYKAMGSPKDHIAYCSIPDSTDLLTTCGEAPGFSNIATKHTNVCNEAWKIPTSAKSEEISVNPGTCLQFARLRGKALIFEP